MKFTVTQVDVVRDGVVHVAVCGGCGAKMVGPHVRSNYGAENLVDAVSIHWSSTHSPRAREIAGK